MQEIVRELIAMAEAHPVTAMAVVIVAIAYINFMTSGPRTY